jgi:hypothetical protein
MKNQTILKEKEEKVENRLQHFIRRYYKIRIFHGIVIVFSLGFLLLLGLVFFGNAFYISPGVRSVIVISIILFSIVLCGMLIIRPFAQMLGWIKGISFTKASEIIQQKHKNIEDRIINIIELNEEKIGRNNVLYDYAIDQKSEKISVFNFDEAISIKVLLKRIVWLGLLFCICLSTFLLWPDFVRKGIGSVLIANEQDGMIGRFSFVLNNEKLEVESGKDFLLKFNVNSDYPPENVVIKFSNSNERVDKVSGEYQYLFMAVNSTINFRLVADGTESEEFVLKVLRKPEVSNIKIKVIAPAYTSLESLVIENDGNVEVPVGSRLQWMIKTVNTDELFFVINSDTLPLEKKSNQWDHDIISESAINYEIICKNLNGLVTNYNYKISIVKDLFPTIEVSESRDSSMVDFVFVQGIVQDDYGFSKLEVIKNSNGEEKVTKLEIKESSIYDTFYYSITPDSISGVYYFRVWDNDKLGGPKFTDSRKITLRTLSKSERESVNEMLVDSIKKSIGEGVSAVEKLRKEVSLFKMEQVMGDLKPWEIQEKMKELMDLKKEVVDYLNNIAKADKEFTDNEKLLNEDKEFTEKAKQIQELMENLMDDEMKDLLKQFEELAKEFNLQKANELTEKVELNLEKLKEQMDMSLELMKKYDMEKDLQKQIEKLNQMADSLNKGNGSEKEDGEKLKEDFKSWEKEYEKKLSEDSQLKKPMGLDSLKKEREDVKKSAEEMSKSNDGKQSGDKREKAGKDIKNLAKKMQSMMGMMGGESEFVDLEDLRQIRNSLNDFSEIQEELNTRVLKIGSNNPTFTEVIKEEKKLESKFFNIRDSLKSIGYKQPIVAKMIGEELFHVETSLRNLFENYTGNKVNVVRIEQNRIMTDVNTIAVKLDELIRNMQEAKGAGEGKKGFMDSKKPKDSDQKGSEKLGKTKSQQESLKEQLKSSIQKMKSGTTGKKERGEMAKMLGEREMMRKALEKVLQDGGIGNDAREKAKEALDMMKEVEKDIIYNRLSDQTLEKDNLIKTKLLEAENAEKERENENRRESKEFKGRFEPEQRKIEKQIEQSKSWEQTLKYNELKLKRFYQEKYLDYMKSNKR